MFVLLSLWITVETVKLKTLIIWISNKSKITKKKQNLFIINKLYSFFFNTFVGLINYNRENFQCFINNIYKWKEF